jgi:hypothetical protein
VPLWWKISFLIVGIWTACLWAMVIRLGYVFPAPWLERPPDYRRPRLPEPGSGINADQLFDRAIVSVNRFVNQMKHASKPPPAQRAEVILPPENPFWDLKEDPMDWKL